MAERRVAKDQAVYFTYRILDTRGQTVEQVDIPVGYVHGAGSRLLEKLESELAGRGIGDTVEVRVSPEEGFGPQRPELTFTDDIDNVPAQFRYVGAEVEMQNDQGEVKTFRVSRIEGGKLTVDGNHPLAGQTLSFQITITDIRPATAQEIAAGSPEDGQSPILH